MAAASQRLSLWSPCHSSIGCPVLQSAAMPIAAASSSAMNSRRISM
jgi:hypothetical protein